MATVRGGGFSLRAKGAIAKTIVYASWKGRPYMRVLVKPAQPRTSGQRSTRAVMGSSAPLFRTLTTTQQAVWATNAKTGNITPVNAFARYNIKYRKRNLGPANAPNVAAGSAPTAPTGLAVTGSKSQILATWTDSVTPNVWAVHVVAQLAGAPTATYPFIVATVLAGVQTATIVKLKPGTWTVGLVAVLNTGAWSLLSTTANATVT